MQITLCPCDASQNYSDCCQPFHASQQIPTNAEALMRSRYSAFVLQNIGYIIATTLPAQQPLLDKQAIADWAEQTDWAGLAILSHNQKVGKHHASVEFNAYFHSQENGETKKLAHHELSYFVKVNQPSASHWYFLDPTVPMQATQKQPCICGSGDKFKHCCGQILTSH